MSEFLAEARVLVRPDTTKFRALLETELAAATAKPLPIAVTPVVAPISTGSTTALTAALTEQRIAQEQLGASTQKTTAQTSLQARANTAAASAANKLAFAQSAVVDAASAVSAAQIQATRSTAAVAAANRAVALALETQDAILIRTTANTLRLAEAQSAEASSALAAARAQEVHARTLAAVNTAGIASGASLLGLRGAVLTAGGAFLGATVAIQGTIKAIQSAANLETELNVFRVTAGATADEMERVSEQAQALGRDITLPGVSAGDAAQALTELSKAGLSVQDSLEGARGVLQLATAAQIDNVRATQLTANALNSFNLGGEQAIRVADLLAGAAKESQGSIEDLGIGLRQVAGAAALLGLSVEDTVALLTQLTRAGLAGSDAGTTLRVALVRLARPDTRKEVEKLVGNLQDLQGNLDPKKLVKFGEEIAKSGGKLDQTNRLYELFGENSLRVIGLLATEGVAGFEDISESINESGIAAETAGARMAGLQGDIENLKNQAEALGVTFGQTVIPPLSAYADLIADVVRRQNEVTQANLATAQSAKGLGERFIEFATGSETAGQSVGDFAEKAAGLGARMQFLGPVTLGASLLIDKFGDSAEDAAGKTGIFDDILKDVSTALGGLGKALRGAVPQGLPEEGLGVQQILNRVSGFDSAEVRARIRGDTDEILSVLQEEQDFLNAQLERQFVQNRPALRDRLQNALLGSVNDIASIQKEGAAATKAAVADAARAQSEADRELLALLSNRRADVERAGEQAEVEGNLAKAIRFEDRLQALIKIQITKIRAQVADEQAKKAAVRDLRLALIASRNEEAALRRERTQEAAAAREEGINLDIEFGEITGNAAKEIAARQKLIALLIKRKNKVDEGTNEWKRLRNAIREQLAAIKDAKEEAETNQDQGKSAQEFFFEQLQAQQGFASNILGNLIPRDQTAGLVGVPSPTPASLQAQVSASANAAAGKAGGGPTAGQASTTNDILLRILEQLRSLNDDREHPEATRQRRKQMAVMDFEHGQAGVM